MNSSGPPQLGWRKSSRSGAEGGTCVELAVGLAARVVHVRDSKNPAGGVLSFGLESWRAFAGELKHGRFDLPARR